MYLIDGQLLAEQFFKTLTRKFRQSCKVWLRYCQFKLGGQHPEAGQQHGDPGDVALQAGLSSCKSHQSEEGSRTQPGTAGASVVVQELGTTSESSASAPSCRGQAARQEVLQRT